MLCGNFGNVSQRGGDKDPFSSIPSILCNKSVMAGDPAPILCHEVILSMEVIHQGL